MTNNESLLQKKASKLQTILSAYDSLAVAFSGGVDSTYLLYAAKQALGERLIAVTARSCSFPERELREATAFCENEGIRHFITDSEELNIEGFSKNPLNRCYLCKTELFVKIAEIATSENIAVIAEGSNTDDDGDYRPGLLAVAEQGVVSPLREAALSKEEIRILSKQIGLPTWDKQSFACLSSRFVYGETISREKLAMVDKAEQLLLDLGFSQVRVRIHGETYFIARIEISVSEFEKILQPEIRTKITETCREIGFRYATFDLSGYRTGSMNEGIVDASAFAQSPFA
ncbi:MAG: ATP-dependent sacrificial sulfur transferase LarE [Clostridiales Family XIII bacterium]|jgi:uncharacterized protein|nr:ATP-dependent sacrificial sulfur transferase LarE [Clostridiales Family XIII bacterium]